MTETLLFEDLYLYFLCQFQEKLLRYNPVLLLHSFLYLQITIDNYSNGENHEDDAVAAAKQAAEAGVKLYTIGVGSPEGQPIRLNGELLKDKDGNIVVTKLDEGTLRKMAQAGGGAYVRAGNEEFGLNPIIDDLRRLEDEHFKSVVFEEYDEQYMYFVAAALVLLAVAFLIGDRRAKRRLFE